MRLLIFLAFLMAPAAATTLTYVNCGGNVTTSTTGGIGCETNTLVARANAYGPVDAYALAVFKDQLPGAVVESPGAVVEASASQTDALFRIKFSGSSGGYWMACGGISGWGEGSASGVFGPFTAGDPCTASSAIPYLPGANIDFAMNESVSARNHAFWGLSWSDRFFDANGDPAHGSYSISWAPAGATPTPAGVRPPPDAVTTYSMGLTSPSSGGRDLRLKKEFDLTFYGGTGTALFAPCLSAVHDRYPGPLGGNGSASGSFAGVSVSSGFKIAEVVCGHAWDEFVFGVTQRVTADFSVTSYDMGSAAVQLFGIRVLDPDTRVDLPSGWSFTLVEIPEPTTFMLVGLALLAVGLRRRR